MSTKKSSTRNVVSFVILVGILLGVSVGASAYTLVFRSGRQVETSTDFVVNDSILTYQVGNGMQASVQLVSIDYLATDRANKEPAGSFAKRANSLAMPKVATTTDSVNQNRRNVTNRDLAAFARKRIEDDAAYDARQKQLGLPSLEESRRQREAEADQAREDIRNKLADAQATENYWRERASSLRAEIASVDSQIQYIQSRLNEISGPWVLAAAPIVFPVATVSTSIVSPALRPMPFPHPGFANRMLGPQMSPRPQISQNQNRIRDGRLAPIPPFAVAGSWPYPAYNYGYGNDPAALLSQLDQLKLQQAGLQARWQELEDEARRAGAYPGWLR